MLILHDVTFFEKMASEDTGMETVFFPRGQQHCEFVRVDRLDDDAMTATTTSWRAGACLDRRSPPPPPPRSRRSRWRRPACEH